MRVDRVRSLMVAIEVGRMPLEAGKADVADAGTAVAAVMKPHMHHWPT